MCTLIALHRCVPGAPLVIAANRDEYLDRPAEPPALRDDTTSGCRVVAQIGDPINGTTISSIFGSSEGISMNNDGVIAFQGTMDDGGTPISAIMLATPILTDPCAGQTPTPNACTVDGVAGLDCDPHHGVRHGNSVLPGTDCGQGTPHGRAFPRGCFSTIK